LLPRLSIIGLDGTEEPMDESIKPLGGAPRLQPLVHAEDMAAAVAFYEALGGGWGRVAGTATGS
jgi:hypothetical protein